jgi:hypothetical protein
VCSFISILVKIYARTYGDLLPQVCKYIPLCKPGWQASFGKSGKPTHFKKSSEFMQFCTCAGKAGPASLTTKRFRELRTPKGFAYTCAWRHSGAGRNLLAGVAISKTSGFPIAE